MIEPVEETGAVGHVALYQMDFAYRSVADHARSRTFGLPHSSFLCARGRIFAVLALVVSNAIRQLRWC